VAWTRQRVSAAAPDIPEIVFMKISSEVSSNLQKSTFQSRNIFFDFIFEKFTKFYTKAMLFI
jgi:hypothetical protein